MRKVTKKDTVQLGLKEGERREARKGWGQDGETPWDVAEGEEDLPGEAALEPAGRQRNSSGDAGGPRESIGVVKAPFGNDQGSRCRRKTEAGV